MTVGSAAFEFLAVLATLSVLPARWRSWLQNAKSSKTAAQHQNGLVLEPVTLKDILALSALPALHRDPFDRLIIAQANRGGFRLVTHDPELARYPVAVLW